MNSLKRQPTNLSCCSFGAMIALTAVTIVVVIGVIWWVLSGHLPLGSFKFPSGNGFNFSSGQTKSVNIPKLAYTVHVTNDQLDEALRVANIPNTKNLTSSIHPDQVEIRGFTTVSNVDAAIFIACVPKVDSNGQVSLEVRDATVAGIRVLPFVTDDMRKSISQSISNYIQNKFNGKITSLGLQEGVIEAKVEPTK